MASNTALTAQQALNKIAGTTHSTAQSIQQIFNGANGSTGKSIQEILNVNKSSAGRTTLTTQQLLYNILKTPLSLTGPVTLYSEQYMLNQAFASSVPILTIIGK